MLLAAETYISIYQAYSRVTRLGDFLPKTAQFKNSKQLLIPKIFSFLETSGGQSCTQYLNVVPFFNTSVN
jgi:hypothetical protein